MNIKNDTPNLSLGQRSVLVTVANTLFSDRDRGMKALRKSTTLPEDVVTAIDAAFSKNRGSGDAIEMLLRSKLVSVKESAGVLDWVRRTSSDSDVSRSAWKRSALDADGKARARLG